MAGMDIDDLPPGPKAIGNFQQRRSHDHAGQLITTRGNQPKAVRQADPTQQLKWAELVKDKELAAPQLLQSSISPNKSFIIEVPICGYLISAKFLPVDGQAPLSTRFKIE